MEQKGTEDIVFVFRDGQARYFTPDQKGLVESNYVFESLAKKILSIHFGESAYFVKRSGKIGARVHMTRDEFFRYVELMLKGET